LVLRKSTPPVAGPLAPWLWLSKLVDQALPHPWLDIEQPVRIIDPDGRNAHRLCIAAGYAESLRHWDA
jgi:hypothetical protein